MSTLLCFASRATATALKVWDWARPFVTPTESRNFGRVLKKPRERTTPRAVLSSGAHSFP